MTHFPQVFSFLEGLSVCLSFLDEHLFSELLLLVWVLNLSHSRYCLPKLRAKLCCYIHGRLRMQERRIEGPQRLGNHCLDEPVNGMLHSLCPSLFADVNRLSVWNPSTSLIVAVYLFGQESHCCSSGWPGTKIHLLLPPKYWVWDIYDHSWLYLILFAT